MIKKLIIILTTGLFLTNCGLELGPESDLSNNTYWQSNNDFRQACNYFYKLVLKDVLTNNEEEFPLMADVMSDNAISNNFNAFANGTYLPAADFGPWDSDFVIIRAANNIIEKLNGFESDNKSRFLAEAKFFRAFAYSDLVRRYGGVPLILKTLEIDDDELYAPRASRDVIIDTIYSDLDYAANNLPLSSELGLDEYGYITSGTAWSLKSRVALREGTWNKFHYNKDYEKHLLAAQEAALYVINSSEYSLFTSEGVESYKQLFKVAGEGPENKEVIWVQLCGIDPSTVIRLNNYWQYTTQGSCGISKSLVDDYLCTDGLPIEISPLYLGRQYAFSEFENRDPRLNGTVKKIGDPFRTGPYIPSLTSLTGYQVNKYHDRSGTEEGNSAIDIILLRYAEVLLNYAEATYELNENISNEDLDISINVLRDRLEMPHLTNNFVTDNNLNMREEIRRERRVELGMEGFRYDDLLRWKIAETELPKSLLGVKLFPSEYPGVDPSQVNMTPDSIVIVEPSDKRSFDPSTHYLWPLPLNQIALNPNLEQNPGWE